MRNIPMFTTELGTASLVLEEIPYKKIAYIRLQDSVDAVAFLNECAQFCCAAGAEAVYATGSGADAFPHYTTILHMSRDTRDLPITEAALFPLQQETLEQWISIYNNRMFNVPNAATMTRAKACDILKEGSGYFIHRDTTLLGVGVSGGRRIDTVVSVQPGAGRDVLLALCNALSESTVCVEVASINTRAIKLYESLGFIQNRVVDEWYKII